MVECDWAITGIDMRGLPDFGSCSILFYVQAHYGVTSSLLGKTFKGQVPRTTHIITGYEPRVIESSLVRRVRLTQVLKYYS